MLSHFSRARLCGTIWTVAHQAPLSRASLVDQMEEAYQAPLSRASLVDQMEGREGK